MSNFMSAVKTTLDGAPAITENGAGAIVLPEGSCWISTSRSPLCVLLLSKISPIVSLRLSLRIRLSL